MLPDFVTAGAAVAAVIYARSGLHTWKQQLRGSSEFELAHSLLTESYRLRDSIESARSPFMSAPELKADDPEAAGLNPSERSHLSFARGLETRWERVSEAARGLDPLLIQAESLWGREVRDKFSPLRKMAYELRFAMDMYLRAHDPRIPADSRKPTLDYCQENNIDEIVFNHSTEAKPDKFSLKLIRAVKPIEDELRDRFPK